MISVKNWIRVCPISILDLQKTLYSGQAFRWIFDEGVHHCVLTVSGDWYQKNSIKNNGSSHHLVLLKVLDQNVYYHSVPPLPHDYLGYYFSLDVDMEELYCKWSQDAWFRSITARTDVNFNGLRMIRGDVVEVVSSFLCSQNNNLKRITTMVMKLCSGYGRPIGEVVKAGDCDLSEEESCILDTLGADMYTVPEFEDLTGDLDTRLREWGFGYRAKYFMGTRDALLEKAPATSRLYLAGISNLDTKFAREELLQLPGIGRKVADCILLFGMNKEEIVPMDTHVKKIVETRYSWMLKRKLEEEDEPMKKGSKPVKTAKANETQHELIQIGFESIFGKRAGWAHSVLFWYQLGNRSMFTPRGWIPFE
jgi:N-glycosylase/DNA lyase